MRGPLEGNTGHLSQGMIASAISTLPLDAGTVVSPTLKGFTNVQRDTTTCNGGPGNAVCGLKVRDEQQGTQCDICGAWYHAICQGLSKAAYNALVKHNTLAFICDACHKHPDLSNIKTKPRTHDACIQTQPGENSQQECPSDNDGQRPPVPHSADTDILSYFKKTIQSLEVSIKDHAKLLAETQESMDKIIQGQTPITSQRVTFAEALKGPAPDRSTQVKSLHSDAYPAVQTDLLNSGSGRSQHVATGTVNNDYRFIVRTELREMEERRKRASSLVVRGLRVGTAREAAAKFSEIVHTLIGEHVTLTEVCRIRSDTDLYRGNVNDSRLRKLILDNSKYLRESENSHVFIRRDLTFQQREELRARFLPRQSQWERNRSQSAGAQPTTHSQPKDTIIQRPGSPRPYSETIPKQVVSVPSSPVSNDPPQTTQSSVTLVPDPQKTEGGSARNQRVASPPPPCSEGN